MSPHYTRVPGVSDISVAPIETGNESEGEALNEAAEALREADIEAAASGIEANEMPQLESMSMDELRVMAAELHVPNRGQILEQAELIAAIRQRL